MNQNLYIFILVISILIIFFVYIIVVGDFQQQVRIDCSPGQCVTNIYSGIKTCPSNNEDIMSINPSIEVCNSPFVCDNPITPFAVQSDGSTNIDGICPTGVRCRCVRRQFCAEYVTAYFTAVNGNPYQPISDQRITFEQIPYYNNAAGNFDQTPPLSPGDNDFCAVPREWVQQERLYPSNCLRGVLAYIPQNPSTFSRTDLDTTPLSCVIGPQCPSESIAYWDNRVSAVRCLQ